MAVFLPLGINNKGSDWISKILGPWLFVNPERIRIRRQPSIATSRTMSGNIFYVWPNRPDEVEFEGIFYGIRSLYEIKLISDSTYTSSEYREVELIYNFEKYRGFITNLQIEGSGESPYAFKYSFSFISKDAIKLATLMLGHFNTLQSEASYFTSAANNAVTAITNGSLILNTAASLGAGLNYVFKRNVGWEQLLARFSVPSLIVWARLLSRSKKYSMKFPIPWQKK